MATAFSRSGGFQRSTTLLLVAALTAASLAGSAPAAGPQSPAAPAAAAPADDTAAISAFFTAVESDSTEARGLLAAAARAEPRLQDWPASLPSRATVRAMISFGQAEQQVMRAFQANRVNDANLMNVLQQVAAAAEQIDRNVAPRAWANAQVAVAESIATFYPIFRVAAPESQWPGIVAGLRDRVAPLLADTARFDRLQRARLLAASARAHAPVPEQQAASDDIAAGVDLYRRAWREALAASAPNMARDYVVQAATATLRRDPSGAQAEAILAEAAGNGTPDWLRRRSVYQLRMRIALGRADNAAHDAAADLWMSAMLADLRASGAPFWAAGISGDVQMSYLVGPLRRGDAAASLARFDRLAEAMRNDGPADFPGMAETNAGEAAAGPVAGALRPDGLGVDLIIVGASGPTRPLAAAESSTAFMRAATGDLTAMDPVATIHWGAAGAGARATAARSDVDLRLLMLESGRGYATLLPAMMQALGAPALPEEQLAMFRQSIAGKIPAFEAHFFTAFGKPIDDLAGGRCAAAGPLAGATPRILLIVPASLSFFPVEMARAPNGRRLIDCYEIRRAPTLAAARAAAARWAGRGRGPLRGIAGLWNPQGDLSGAEAERPLIAAAAGNRRAVSLLDPTSAAAILRPAGGADIVHIAAHGRLGLLDPFDSSVAVGRDRVLTFREITRRPASATALLIVLSACEAGLSSPQSGEVAYWGMSSAFLTAGAGGVVGPLWQVRDDAAALIMGKFYALLLRQNRPPAAALREAQLWLRDASVSELLDFVEASEAYADDAGRPRLDSLRAAISAAGAAAPATTPYADPMLWGGFGYFGTYPDG
jgi:hypothetical protein